MTPSEVKEYLLEKSSLEITEKPKGIKIGNWIYTETSFPKFLGTYIKENLVELPDTAYKLLKLPQEDFKELSLSVYLEMRGALRKANAIDLDLGDLAGVAHEKILDLIPVTSIDDGKTKIYNKALKRLSRVDFEYWKLVAPKDSYAALMSSTPPSIFEYDPLQDEPHAVVTSEGMKLNKFNSHIPAPWRELEYSGKMPKLASRFFKHLFPNKEARFFVYTWMYHMLTDRARTFLYLPQVQGTGKTTFAYICGALVGRTNFEVTKADFARNNFNSYVQSKRLLLLDEFTCWSNEEKDTLKRVINDKVQIESKGVDQKTVNNFCSFIICNNSAEGVVLDPVDRRFSLPETTSTAMLKAFTVEEIEKINLEHEKEQSQFIADIGYWILENFSEPKYTRDQPWQGRRFEEVVFASAREGFKYIIDKILSKKEESYSYSKLRSEYRALVSKNAYFPPYFKVREYLESFRYKGEKIAEVSGDGITLEIIPAEKYRPEEEE